MAPPGHCHPDRGSSPGALDLRRRCNARPSGRSSTSSQPRPHAPGGLPVAPGYAHALGSGGSPSGPPAKSIAPSPSSSRTNLGLVVPARDSGWAVALRPFLTKRICASVNRGEPADASANCSPRHARPTNGSAPADWREAALPTVPEPDFRARLVAEGSRAACGGIRRQGRPNSDWRLAHVRGSRRHARTSLSQADHSS
jgi:hypothetical protein